MFFAIELKLNQIGWRAYVNVSFQVLFHVHNLIAQTPCRGNFHLLLSVILLFQELVTIDQGRNVDLLVNGELRLLTQLSVRYDRPVQNLLH